MPRFPSIRYSRCVAKLRRWLFNMLNKKLDSPVPICTHWMQHCVRLIYSKSVCNSSRFRFILYARFGECNIFQHFHHLHINSNFSSRKIPFDWIALGENVWIKTEKPDSTLKKVHATNWITLQIESICKLMRFFVSNQIHFPTNWMVQSHRSTLFVKCARFVLHRHRDRVQNGYDCMECEWMCVRERMCELIASEQEDNSIIRWHHH